MVTRIIASRRTVIRGALVATAYALAGPFGQDHQSAPLATTSGATVSIGNSSCAIIDTYDATWTNRSTARFPVSLSLANRKELLSLEMAWDQRLFIVHGPAIAIAGSDAREVKITQDRPGHLTIALAPDIDELALRVEVISTYPNENLDAIAPTKVLLIDAGGNTIDQLTLDLIAAPSAPWSVEVITDWVSRQKDVVPSRITLRSVGPNPAPSGLTVLAAYADVLATPTVTVQGDEEEAVASVEERSTDGITEITALTSNALSPGEEIEIIFPTDGSDSIPAPFTDFVPYVRFVPPSDSSGMRASGKHDSYPVTDSGSQLSTYLPAPSAG